MSYLKDRAASRHVVLVTWIPKVTRHGKSRPFFSFAYHLPRVRR
jgi:hypothetical protein